MSIVQTPYDTPKPEGDVDLVAAVREKMVVLLGLETVQKFFDPHQFVTAAQGRHSDVQRLCLSRWFTRQLMTAGHHTHDLRPQLNCFDTTLWLKAVTEAIIPAMQQFQLPRELI